MMPANSRESNAAEILDTICGMIGLPGNLPLQQSEHQSIIARIDDLVRHERSSRQAAETLRVASIELTRNLDPTLVLEALLDYLCWLLPYDYASVSLLEDKNSLVKAVSRDFRTEREGAAELQVCVETGTREQAMQALERRKTYILSSSGGACELHPGVIIPLCWEDSVLGVISAERTSKPFTEEQIRYAEALASQAAVAIRNAKLFAELKKADREIVRSYDATIEGWSRALELRDHDTEGHTLRVTELTLRLARHMHLDDTMLTHIRRGSLLHDIGKVAIPDAILLKPEPLNEAERRVMEMHPEYARQMLAEISYLQPALDIPYCHHERWDGSGYPRGLTGTAIPLAARIFSIVDVWDALTHDRPYHKARSEIEVMDYIVSQAGYFFDPDIIPIFSNMMKPA